MAGNSGRESILADWWFSEQSAKFVSAHYCANVVSPYILGSLACSWMRRAYRLLVSMEFITDSCARGHSMFPKVLDTRGKRAV